MLQEGVDLAGDEVEVTVLFLDVRDFTAFAERASAHEVVTRLNDLRAGSSRCCCATAATRTSSSATACWPSSAPPGRLEDHADRAVEAAVEVAAVVREAYGGSSRSASA